MAHIDAENIPAKNDLLLSGLLKLIMPIKIEIAIKIQKNAGGNITIVNFFFDILDTISILSTARA